MRPSNAAPQVMTTVLYVVTGFASQFAGFLLLPIVTRFLEPEEYAAYAIALALASLVGMFGSSWIRNVGFRFYFDAKAAGTTRAFYRSLITLQAGLIAVLMAGTLAVMALMPSPPVSLETMLAAAVMVLVADFHTLTVSLLRPEDLHRRFVRAEVSSAATRVIGTSAGLALGFTTPAFLLLAAAAASATGGTIAFLALRKRLTGPTFFDRQVVAAMGRHAPGALPFSVGEWFTTLADRLILDHFAARAVVGIYAAGHSIADRLIGGIISAVMMVAWSDVLNAWNAGGIEAARRAVRRYLEVFLWFTVGPLVVLELYSGAIVQLLGRSYADAAQVMGLVAAAAWSRGFGNCFNRHLELQKRFSVLSGVTLLGAAVNVVLNFALIPTYLALGAAAATFASQALVATIFIVTRDRRLVEFPTRDFVLVLMAVLVSGTVARVAFDDSILGVVAFGLVYLAVMAVVWVPRFLNRDADA